MQTAWFQNGAYQYQIWLNERLKQRGGVLIFILPFVAKLLV